MAAKRKSSSGRSSRKESPDGQQLLVLELQEIHNAETQLARVLPRIAKAAQSEQLQQMLEQRQEQGARLIEDIDSALEEMEESAGRKKNVAAEGLINDVRQHVQELQPGPALDAVLIAGMQKTEHYCIAAWGTAKSLAQLMEQESVVEAMERALQEGKELDEQLTQLAESEINPALQAGEEAEGEEDEEEEEEEESSGTGRRRARGREGGRERRAR
jgi:ferritin-like metal-binding protein YciE